MLKNRSPCRQSIVAGVLVTENSVFVLRMMENESIACFQPMNSISLRFSVVLRTTVTATVKGLQITGFCCDVANSLDMEDKYCYLSYCCQDSMVTDGVNHNLRINRTNNNNNTDGLRVCCHKSGQYNCRDIMHNIESACYQSTS